MLDADLAMTVIGEFASLSESAEVDLAAADILVADVRDELTISELAGLADGIGVVFLADDPALFRALERQPPGPAPCFSTARRRRNWRRR